MDRNLQQKATRINQTVAMDRNRQLGGTQVGQNQSDGGNWRWYEIAGEGSSLPEVGQNRKK